MSPRNTAAAIGGQEVAQAVWTYYIFFVEKKDKLHGVNSIPASYF